MMETVKSPEATDPRDELDALIEEARRRARRRRLGIFAATIAVAGVVGSGILFVGGGDGGGSSGRTESGGPDASGSGSQSSTPGTAGYRCPSTSLKDVRSSSSSKLLKIPGCSVRVLADLPAGWDQRPSKVTALPGPVRAVTVLSEKRPFRRNPESVNILRGTGRIALLGSNEVQFASYRLNDPLPSGRPIPGRGVLLTLSDPEIETEVAGSKFGLEPLSPRRSGHWVATAKLRLDGIDFRVKLTSASGVPSRKRLAEARAIIDSLDTRQRLARRADYPDLSYLGATRRQSERAAQELEPTQPPRSAAPGS